jgi:hypothetical protein
VCLALLFLGSGCDVEKRLVTPSAPFSPLPARSPTPTTGAKQTFAIYLTDPEIPPARLAIQSHLELAADPILTVDDIISYVWDTHEITLTAAGLERLHALSVPTHGKSFVVCLDRQLIYAGAFWAAYSSQSFDGVVIDPTLATLERPVVQIQLGYPGPGFFRGEDPRSDARILAALEGAGKLR